MSCLGEQCSPGHRLHTHGIACYTATVPVNQVTWCAYGTSSHNPVPVAWAVQTACRASAVRVPLTCACGLQAAQPRPQAVPWCLACQPSGPVGQSPATLVTDLRQSALNRRC